MDDICLTDLVDISLLQKFQDSFSKMTGLASLTTDVNGKPITQGSNFTRYCRELTRNSKVGCARCEDCNRIGAMCTLDSGHAETFLCHAGLCVFVAPVMVDTQVVGCYIGGQVLTEKPNRNFSDSVARQIGVDTKVYWEALQEVPILDKEQIKSAAALLFESASVMSEIAFGKYQAIQNAKETERVANMKTDFLANMSHEIRTPMNAVIGMAEMALREELPASAREYILQIKSSGTALLNIINDILDFSKIESGKMDICPDEYEFLSMLHDISNILMTRLRDKDVELLVDVNPELPSYMYGDSLRIRQILINIANNAVKFTKQGHVRISVDYDRLDSETIMLRIDVRDTGIGIAKEDLNKLFVSFQQVDSKRNRNIEGTGLGLAICKRLLDMMEGDISVRSEYGKGSVFSFWLPQKVTNWNPCISIEKPDECMVIGYFSKKCIAKQFYRDINRLKVDSMALCTMRNFDDMCEIYREDMQGKQLVFFTEEKQFEEELTEFADAHKEIMFKVMTGFFSSKKQEKSNVQYVKKPLSTITLGLVLNNESADLHQEAVLEFDFIAPTARVLIVDDNEINLTVSEGLLKPLEMQVVTVTSGVKAIKLLENERFDLVFMDHMMPEVDGVETTRIIRRMLPKLADMPIIALTANAVGDAKKMFLSEGMDDFVAKPIELRALISKVKQWLPKEKIQKKQLNTEEPQTQETEIPVIGDLDVGAAIGLIGSMEIYRTLLCKYYENIPVKANIIREYEKKEDISAYTIEVHALKSLSRQVGAMQLADMAAELEIAGNEDNRALIHEKTDAMLEKYLGYAEVMKPFAAPKDRVEEAEKRPVDAEQLKELFTLLHEALDTLDMDAMEEITGRIGQFLFEGDFSDYYTQLNEAVRNLDVFTCEDILVKWEEKM